MFLGCISIFQRFSQLNVWDKFTCGLAYFQIVFRTYAGRSARKVQLQTELLPSGWISVQIRVMIGLCKKPEPGSGQRWCCDFSGEASLYKSLHRVQISILKIPVLSSSSTQTLGSISLLGKSCLVILEKSSLNILFKSEVNMKIAL